MLEHRSSEIEKPSQSTKSGFHAYERFTWHPFNRQTSYMDPFLYGLPDYSHGSDHELKSFPRNRRALPRYQYLPKPEFS